MEHFLDNESLFEYGGISHLSDQAPAFPLGEGWQIALRSLVNYPIGTELYVIETCGAEYTLLTNTNPKNYKGDIWDEKLLHTALFVEDLIELQQKGYVEGVKPITEFQYMLNKFNSLLKAGCTLDENGDLLFYTGTPEKGIHKHTLERPKIEKYASDYLSEEWDEIYREELIAKYKDSEKKYIEIPDSFNVTEQGKQEFIKMAKKLWIPTRIESRIKPLIDLNLFDTAVRETAILCEDILKKFHKTHSFGEKLIELHIKKCIEANAGMYNAGIKVYRQELRLMNIFTRNPFMHNIFDISRENYDAILYRQCELFRLMEQAFKKILAT